MLKDNLRALREAHGISQKTLAEGLGFSLQRYNHYETGVREPGEETLKRIAAYYHVPVSRLFCEQISQKQRGDFAEFKERIRALRQSRNFSASHLAVLLNRSEGAIRMWEAGRSKPDADTLIQLSRLCNVSTDYLLGISEVENIAHPVFNEDIEYDGDVISKDEESCHIHNIELNIISDDDLVKHLESITDVDGYIKALMRADIAVTKSKENK